MVCGSLQNAVTGATVVYPAESFDAAACLKSVQDERYDYLYLLFLSSLVIHKYKPAVGQRSVSSFNSLELRYN